MKKIKEFYNENRVFTILMGVVLICVILILAVMLKYFFFGNSSSPYGERLKDEKKYILSDKEQKSIASALEEDGDIKKSSVRISVRTIYVTIEFNEGVDLNTAKNKAVDALTKFSEKQMGYYDIEFILIEEHTDDNEGFKIMGAKNVNGTNIVWNNNNPVSPNVE